MHGKSHSTAPPQSKGWARPTPACADDNVSHHDKGANMTGFARRGKRHESRRGRILILAVVLSCALLAPGEFLSDALSVESAPLTPQTQQDKSETAGLTRSQKRVKYNACVTAGKHECFKRIQAAVDWCMKNSGECRPLLEGGRMSVQAYGDQVGAKCMQEQEQKCRQEWGL